MRKVLPVVVLVVAALLVAGGMALARGRGEGPATGPGACPHEGRCGWRGGCGDGLPEELRERLQERLREAGVSEEQLAQLAQLREKYDDETAPICEQLRSKMQELQTLRQQGLEKDPAADSLRAEIKQLREQLSGKREEFRQQMLAVLTPEQREALRGQAACGFKPRAGGGGRGCGKWFK